MPDDDPDRVEGMEFTSTTPVLEDVSYPITAGELVAQHGDHSVERTNAEPITIRELFDPINEETFESPAEVRQMMLNLMPSESVGRERYSDRGGAHPKETDEVKEIDGDDSV